jgi:predicted PurR-regulated permease PerM
MPPSAGDEPTPPNAETVPGLQVSMPISIRSLALYVLAVLATIYMVKQMREVLMPVALSGLVYHMLAPFVHRLVRWRIPRTVAALLVMTCLIGVSGLAVWSLTDEAVAVVQQLPEAARTLRAAVRTQTRQAGGSIPEQVQQAAKELESTANEAIGGTPPRGVTRVQIEEPVLRGSDVLLGGARNLFVVGGSIILVLVCATFMLIGADRLKRIVVEIAGPTLTKKKVTVQILDEIAKQVQRFLLVQLVTSAVVALATGLVLWWLGLQNAAIWGIVTGVLNTVPYFGPLLATMGLVGVALMQFGTLEMTAWVAGSSLLITSVEGYLLTPYLLGKSAQMNQIAVFIAILFWSWMWGPLGLLLAVPLTTTLKVICDHVEELQPLGKLMGE